MAAQTARDRINSWSENSPQSFFNWIRDIEPRILINNRYQPFEPTEKQKDLINKILKSEDNRFTHSLSLLIQPRRHGKSTIYSLIILWLFTSRKNLTIQCLGNTESHTRRTQFNTLKKIIANSPFLRKLIPEKHMLVFEIHFPALGNTIQMSPGNNVSTAFGEKIDVLWVSDLHACADLQPFNALQSSLLDSRDSLLLIDSNVDVTDGPVHQLQQEAVNDPTIFCEHVEYADLHDYCKRAPEWISRPKAKRLQKTTLPTDFRRDILGKRSDAKNALFPTEVIELCKADFKIPVEDISELTQGRAYKVGGGLDRSKSLLGSVTGADNTIWSVILKVANPEHGEPEVYILNQVNIVPNTSRNIKKTILRDHERYKLDNVILEDYEITDILPWMENQRIPCEKMTAHSTRQNASFPEFARITREGRFHFPRELKGMEKEMRTFAYTQRKGGDYSFSHSSKKFKDDRIFSTNWAIFSLRSQIMNLYSLKNIQCNSKRPNRHACFLMGGNLELLCSEQCEAAQEVKEMHRRFLQYQFDSELILSEFYKQYVKLTGAKLYQAI